MELTSSAPRAHRQEVESFAVSERVLLRVIDFSFGPAGPSTRPFRTTFREFVEAYFILVQEGEGLLDAPAPRPRIIATLAEKVRSQEGTVPFRIPARQFSVMVLSSIFALAEPVRGGVFSPSEAAEHVTSVLFDGLRRPERAPQQNEMPSAAE